MELDNCFEQNNGIFILDPLYHQVLSNCSKSIENEIVYHIEGHFGIGQDSNEHTIKHFSLSYNITFTVTELKHLTITIIVTQLTQNTSTLRSSARPERVSGPLKPFYPALQLTSQTI
jgi:hypothetical protein